MTWDERMQKLTSLMVPNALAYITAFTPNDGFAELAGIDTIGEEDLSRTLKRNGLEYLHAGHDRFNGPTYKKRMKRWDVLSAVLGFSIQDQNL